MERMVRLLAHRGPDDERIHITPQIALGFRRLAVIDLASGAQPMSTPDGRFWIVLNGEIYNYRELRRELESRGISFRTRSDTEVLLALFQAEGDRCLERLSGMFAFAVWDERDRRLFLARDRLGKKPLVYAHLDGGGIAFASELNALAALPGIDTAVDAEAVNLYLAYQYVPHPWTIYRGIRKLPPAHTLVWKPGGEPEIRRYWKIDFERKRRVESEAALAGEFREQLRASVRRRLVADVPVGAFLSGGIDSSAVVAFMSEEASKVRTFSIGFEEEGFSELPHARIVAKHFGTEHHEFTVRPEAAAILSKLVWHYGEPFADTAALPTYYLSEVTRSSVTVALSGDGGDEAFAGYRRYRWLGPALTNARMLRLLPQPARDAAAALFPLSWRPGRGMRRLLTDRRDPFALWNEVWYCPFTSEDRRDLYDPDFAAQLTAIDVTWLQGDAFRAAPAADLVERAMWMDMAHHLPDQLLVKMDIASMAHGLEVRSPFLDHELLEWAATLPAGWKRKAGSGKRLVKRALEGILPPEILNRGKRGFSVPVDAWLRGAVLPLLRDSLLAPDARSRRYFRPQAVERLVREHVEGRRNHGQRLWILLALELWHRSAAGGRGTEPAR